MVLNVVVTLCAPSHIIWKSESGRCSAVEHCLDWVFLEIFRRFLLIIRDACAKPPPL